MGQSSAKVRAAWASGAFTRLGEGIRRIDRLGLLVAVALAAAVVVLTRPLWSTPQFFVTGDGRMHLFRLFAFDQTLRQGVVDPRWLSNLAFGYGYPIFDFYPPLSVYLAETLHLLGLGYVDAIKGEFILSLALAAGGAYVLGQSLFAESGKAAGLVTAIVYAFAPYLIHDVYLRGATTETLAAAVLPWLVWALRLAVKQQTKGSLALVALMTAILLYAHSLTLAIAAPFLCVYVCFELLRSPAAVRVRALLQIVGATLLAAGVGAIYWLPFIAELPLVKMGQGASPFADTFRSMLAEPQELVQSSLLYQYGPVSLGLATVALTILAMAGAWATKSWRARPVVLLFGAAAMVGAVTMIKPMYGAWTILPFATVVQFPWRVTVLVDLGFAVAIGGLPIILSRAYRWGRLRLLRPAIAPGPSNVVAVVGTLVLSGSIMWTSIANLAPREQNYPTGDIGLADLARFEGYSGFAGTTSFDEFMPATLTVPAQYNDPIFESPQVDADQTTVDLARYTATERVFDVRSATAARVLLRAFAFPNWQARVDGVPVPAFPTTPLGLLTVDVPAGTHRVVIALEDTPPRRLGMWLSGFCVLALLILGGRMIRNRDRAAVAFWSATGLALAIGLIPTALAVTASPSTVQPQHIDVSPALEMIGLDVDRAHWSNTWQLASPGAALDLAVYWRVKQAAPDKTLSWRLVDSAGGVRLTSEQLPRFGSGFARAWVPNEIVEDNYRLPLTPGLPSGSYQLDVSYGQLGYVRVATIELPRGTLDELKPDIAHAVNARVGERIHLLGYTAPEIAHPGTQYPITLYWRTDDTLFDDLTPFVQLQDDRGERVAQRDGVPGIGSTPTSLWLPGRIIAEHQNLDLPPDLKPGLYTLVAGLYGRGVKRLPVSTDQGLSPDDSAVLGHVKIPLDARDVRPEHARPVSFGSTIRLLGYDLETTPTQAALKLYWQALAPIEGDYQVFVHVVDATGQIVAQQDAMPGEGHYPTHIWDPGEQVVDPYRLPLNLPPGSYDVTIGMYSAESGERLVTLGEQGNALPDRQVNLGKITVAGR